MCQQRSIDSSRLTCADRRFKIN